MEAPARSHEDPKYCFVRWCVAELVKCLVRSLSISGSANEWGGAGRLKHSPTHQNYQMTELRLVAAKLLPAAGPLSALVE